MISLIYSLAIIGILAAIGNSFYGLLDKKNTSTFLENFIFSAWLGLIFITILLSNIYHLMGHVSIQQISWPILVILLFAWIIKLIRYRSKSYSLVFFDYLLYLIPILGLALLSVPFMGKSGLGFYYSDNGEYIKYAVLADVVKFHGSSIDLISQITANSRESMVAILCAFFATIFNKATLFIIEPFANALAWLAFAMLGILFKKIVCRGNGLCLP